jgi:hypothetical protein
MGRGVKTDFETGTLEKLRQISAGRSLAVGTRHVGESKSPMEIVKLGKKGAGDIEAEPPALAVKSL